MAGKQHHQTDSFFPPDQRTRINQLHLHLAAVNVACQRRWSYDCDTEGAFVSHCFLFLLLFVQIFNNQSQLPLILSTGQRSSFSLERFGSCQRLLKRQPGDCCINGCDLHGTVCACSVAQSRPSLSDHTSRPSGSSVHATFQASILEWVAISSSWGSSRFRGQTCVSCFSCIDRQTL